MNLSELEPHTPFVFEDDGMMQPHKVIEQKGETTFCETPSGNRQYYKSNQVVLIWAHCPHCIGCGCPTCSGNGFLLSYQ